MEPNVSHQNSSETGTQPHTEILHFLCAHTIRCAMFVLLDPRRQQSQQRVKASNDQLSRTLRLSHPPLSDLILAMARSTPIPLSTITWEKKKKKQRPFKHRDSTRNSLVLFLWKLLCVSSKGIGSLLRRVPKNGKEHAYDFAVSGGCRIRPRRCPIAAGFPNAARHALT